MLDLKQFSKPQKISLAIIIITGLWVASGWLFGTSREDTNSGFAPASQADLEKLLRIEELKAKPYLRTVVVNGFTEANRVVALKPEVDGKIVELPVKKGTLVKTGQSIARLDMRDRAEKLAEAKARVKQYEIEYDAAKQLKEKGFRPELSLAESKTNLEKARGDLMRTQLDYDNTQIKAPFDGRLEELNVEVGDFVLSGFMGSFDNKSMALVVEDNPIIISGQISEKDLPHINRDADVKVALSDGRTLTGKIKFLSQYADPNSRTFKVEVAVANPNHDIPVGMTATFHLPADHGSAYLVSSSVLALDDTGAVGVKTIKDNNTVEFKPVMILENTEQGLWIGGLPESIRLITQGQAFVSAGQTIPSPSAEKASN